MRLAELFHNGTQNEQSPFYYACRCGSKACPSGQKRMERKMSKAHFTMLAAVTLKLALAGRNAWKRKMSKAHFTTLAAEALKLALAGQKH